MNSEQNKQDPKQRILQAAFNLLKKSPVEKLSSALIAKEAGISKSGFFHHFPTIEDFYLFMIDQMMTILHEQVQSTEHDNWQEFVWHTHRIMMEYMKHSPEVVFALIAFTDKARFSQMHHHKVQQMVTDSIEKWSEHLKQLLPTQASDGQIEQLSTIIDIYFTGVSHHYLFTGNDKLYFESSKYFISMLELFLQKNGLGQ